MERLEGRKGALLFGVRRNRRRGCLRFHDSRRRRLCGTAAVARGSYSFPIAAAAGKRVVDFALERDEVCRIPILDFLLERGRRGKMGDGRLRPSFFFAASVPRSHRHQLLLPRPDAATAGEGRQRRGGGPGGGGGGDGAHAHSGGSAVEADPAAATRGDVRIGLLDRLGSVRNWNVRITSYSINERRVGGCPIVAPSNSYYCNYYKFPY